MESGITSSGEICQAVNDTLQENYGIVLSSRRRLRSRFYYFRLIDKLNARSLLRTKIAIVSGAVFSILTIVAFKGLPGFHQRLKQRDQPPATFGSGAPLFITFSVVEALPAGPPALRVTGVGTETGLVVTVNDAV